MAEQESIYITPKFWVDHLDGSIYMGSCRKFDREATQADIDAWNAKLAADAAQQEGN